MNTALYCIELRARGLIEDIKTALDSDAGVRVGVGVVTIGIGAAVGEGDGVDTGNVMHPATDSDATITSTIAASGFNCILGRLSKKLMVA